MSNSVAMQYSSSFPFLINGFRASIFFPIISLRVDWNGSWIKHPFSLVKMAVYRLSLPKDQIGRYGCSFSQQDFFSFLARPQSKHFSWLLRPCACDCPGWLEWAGLVLRLPCPELFSLPAPPVYCSLCNGLLSSVNCSISLGEHVPFFSPSTEDSIWELCSFVGNWLICQGLLAFLSLFFLYPFLSFPQGSSIFTGSEKKYSDPWVSPVQSSAISISRGIF